MKNIYIIIAFFLVFFTACEDVKYEEKAPSVPALNNVRASNEDNNIKLTWNAPTGLQAYSVLLNYDGEEIILKNNPAEYTIVNPVVNVEHAITLKAISVDSTFSEGITVKSIVGGTNPVTNLSGARDGNDIVVSWTLPANNTATAIDISYNDKTVNLSGMATTYRISNVAADQKYTIGVRTKNATLKSNYVYTIVGSLNFAFLTTFENIGQIQDDDEIAAANWFIANYPTGEIVPLSKIKDGTADLSKYSVIWIHVDRVGTGEIPADFKDSNVLNKITSYYKNGGSLLLSIHGTQYITDLGRTIRKPGILGAGSGGVGNDTWTFNANIGMVYNHYNHPLFAGMTPDPSFFGHPTIPLIGPGNREDHNSMWDLNSYGYRIPADGENVVKVFETENNAVVLATWGHVTDFCCAGIVEFKPTATYKGTCLAIGLAAYEWNQNTGTNMYQANIEKLTRNAIDYLK